MKKPFKTLSTTAMAAVFAASAIVPVASAATPDESVKAYEINKVILEENGQLVAVDYQAYMLNLPFLSEEAKNGVKYVEFGDGLKVSALDYLLELGVQGNNDEATYNELVNNEQIVEVEVLEGTITEDGTIEVEESTEVVVKSATATNATTLSVTLSDGTVHVVTLEKALEANVATDVAFKIGEVEYTANVTWVVEEEADLTVESVSAINALELQVKFSGNVDKALAEENTHYQITLNGKVVADAIEDIKATDKTALVRLKGDALSTGDKVTVQISDAVTGERYASEIIEYTSAAPVLTKAPEVKANDIVLTFDRPAVHLDGLTMIKLDGIALADQTLTAVAPEVAGNYEYTVALGDSKEDAVTVGTHEVKIFDVADAAAKNPEVAAYLTKSYEITEAGTQPEVPEAAPVVEKVTALNANKFEIEFDQPLANSEFDLKVIKGNHTFAGETVYNSADIESSTVYFEYAPTASQPNRYVVIVTGDPDEKDLNPLYKAGEESVDLTVEVTNHKSATELLVGKKEVKEVTLSKTDGKPEADNGKIIDNTILLPLNGLAEFTADYDDNKNNHIVLRDAEGIVIENKFFEADIAGKVLSIEAKVEDNNPLVNAEGNIVGAPFTVEFKANAMMFEEDLGSVKDYNLVDLRNDAHLVSAVSVDEPTVDPGEENFQYYVLDAGEIKIDSTLAYGQIQIAYGKEMDKATALDINNYKIDGEVLPAGSKAEFVNDTKTVAITVPEGTFKATTDYRFQIETDVLTKAGQKVVRDAQSKLPVVAIGSVIDNEAPELVNAEFAVAVADKDADISKVKTTNLVKLTFSEAVELESGDLDKAVEVLINNVKYTGTVADEYDADRQLDDKEKNTDRVLILELEEKVGINQDATITVVKKDDSKDYVIVDAEGNKVKPGSLTIKAGKAVKVKQTAAEAEAAVLETAVNEAKALIATLKADVAGAADSVAAQVLVDAAQAAVDAVTTIDSSYVTTAWDAVISEAEDAVELLEAVEAAQASIATLATDVADANDAAAGQVLVDAAQDAVDAVTTLDATHNTTAWDTAISDAQKVVDVLKAVEAAQASIDGLSAAVTGESDKDAAQALVDASQALVDAVTALDSTHDTTAWDTVISDAQALVDAK